MPDALSVGTRCNSPLQVMGLLIVALLISVVAIIFYKSIRYVCDCILTYRKVRINIDKGDTHFKSSLSR